MKHVRVFVALLLAVLQIISAVSVVAAVESQSAEELVTAEEAIYVPEAELPDSEELFEGYVRQAFGLDNGISLFSTGNRTAGSQLTGDAKGLYDLLAPVMKEIASGERTSTVITIGKKINTTEGWKTPELEYTFEGSIVDAINPLVDALLADMPYEMYWFGKTQGVGLSHYANGTKTLYVTLSFAVAGNYGANYSVTSPQPQKISTAVANASALVEKHEKKSDLDKLKAYRDEICSLVTYDDDAAAGGYFASNDDPWQLVSVFDGDSTTNVVCEGYSKAFQYLCDQSEFEGEVQCYCVSGQMVDSYGAGGGHMWNIVTLEENNYLVDVTNSDTGSIGGGEIQPLFLAGGVSDLRQFTYIYADGTTEIVTLTGYLVTAVSAGYYYEDLLWDEAVANLSYHGYGETCTTPPCPCEKTESTVEEKVWIGKFKLVKTDDNERTVTVKLEEAVNEQTVCRVMVALYENGKMVGLPKEHTVTIKPDEELASIEAKFETNVATTVKVFVIDEADMTPLCSAVEQKLQ